MTSIQIIPLNDTGEHEQTKFCKCKPRLETVNDVLIVCHNAYDIREAVEIANELLRNPNEGSNWEIITQD